MKKIQPIKPKKRKKNLDTVCGQPTLERVEFLPVTDVASLSVAGIISLDETRSGVWLVPVSSIFWIWEDLNSDVLFCVKIMFPSMSMWAVSSNNRSCRILLLSCFRVCFPSSISTTSISSGSSPHLLLRPCAWPFAPDFARKTNNMVSSFSSFAQSSKGRRGLGMKDDRERSRGRGGGRGGGHGGGREGSSKDTIDALGRLLTRILRHMASELNLNIRNDGYVKVEDLLKLNMKTFANIPLRAHTVDDIKEAVRRDNKQRFSLLEEDGELLIRANQGHTITTVESESLLKPIVSADEIPVCVHGTYKKNLESIMKSGLKRMQRLHVHFSCGLPTDGEVISGMRRDVNVLIFLDVKKALEDGMKIYISDNRVILTEGFDGVVPIKYFEEIESWPDRKPIPLQNLV